MESVYDYRKTDSINILAEIITILRTIIGKEYFLSKIICEEIMNLKKRY